MRVHPPAFTTRLSFTGFAYILVAADALIWRRLRFR